VLFLWLLAGDPLIGDGFFWVVATCYGTYALNNLSLIYGFCALGLILASGGLGHLAVLLTVCVTGDRALVCLPRHPRWGYATMGFFAILLASFAVRFAQHG